MLSTNMVIFITLNIFTWSLYICFHGEVFGCKLSPYRDSSNHKRFVWNCSHQDIEYIPDIPTKHSRDVIAVDISYNNFRVLREATFSNLTFDIKFLFLKKNDIASIQANAFRRVSKLLLLDISSCSLGTKSIQLGAFDNLSLLETLNINDNSFQSYPAGEISKLESLVNLTIDIFRGFHFDDNFLNLKALRNIFLEPKGLLTLTNNSFQGLRNSPIRYLDLNVYNQVDNFCKDLPEDLFCSFPFLKGLSISFGISCGIKCALRTLKCLQNKQLDYFHSSDNHELTVNEVTITDFDVEYLRNACIKELLLQNNDISQIAFQLPMSKFQSCLEVVDLSSNKIQFSLSQRLWLTLLMFSPNIQVIKICCQNAQQNARHSISKIWGHTYSDEYNRRRETRVKRSEAFRVVFPKRLKYFDISYANEITTDMRKISIEAYNLLFLNISGTSLYISSGRYNSPVGSVYLDFPLLTKIDASHTATNVAHLSLEKLLSLTSLTVKDGSFLPPRTTLHGLKSLKYIDMSNIHTWNLPIDFFASQKDSNITIILDRNQIYTSSNNVLKALDILDYIYKLSMRDCSYETPSYMYHTGFQILQTLRVAKFYLRNTINCFCNEKHAIMTLWKIRKKIADLDDMICRNTYNNGSKNLKELFTTQHWRSFRLNCMVDDILLEFSIVLLSTTLIFLISTMVIYKFSIISRCKALDVRDKLQAMYGCVCEFYHEMRRRRGYTYSPLNPEDIDTTRERNEEIAMATVSTEMNNQTKEIRESSHPEDSDQTSREPEPAQTRAQ